MPKSKPERRNPLIIDKSEPVSLFTGPPNLGPNLSRLDPGQIRTDGGTQMRAGLNEETVVEYLELIHEPRPEGPRWPFPPVIVFHDGEAYWMGDGFHRVEAARRYVQREQIAYSVVAEVRPGTRRDAVLCAAGANAAHGLRRTNADKRRAVETLLRDEEWGQWSDREIARRCHVSNNFVSELRRSLSSDDSEKQTTALLDDSSSENQKTVSLSSDDSENQRVYTTRHGTVARMNISGQREAPKMRIPKGYTPPAAPAIKPPLTLDETLNLIWDALRTFVRSNAPADQLAWLASLPDDYGFYRDTPADRSMAPETLQTAKAQVVGELRAQRAPDLAHREGRRRRGTPSSALGAQPGPESDLTGLEQANGAIEQESAMEWLPPPSGRPRLPRSMRVSKLLNLYQEVVASLDEYRRLVDSVGAKYAEDMQRAIAAMIVELEKEGGQDK